MMLSDAVVIYANDTSFYPKCDQISDLWQQLALDSGFESELQDTKNWSRKRFVVFNTEKTQLSTFDYCYSSFAIDMKMDLPAEENLFLNMLGLPFSSKLD